MSAMSSVRVSFEISSAFRRITPGLNAEQTRAEAAARAEAQGARLTEEQMEAIVMEYQKASTMLAENGVCYAGSCFGLLDGDWTMGALTIGLSPLSYRTPEIAVAGMTKILAAEHGQRAEVSALTLPCGEATLVIKQSPDLRLPAEFTEGSEDLPIDVARLQAFIPVPPSVVPGAQTLVTVTFSTPSTDHWADYCEMLVPFLNSLRFLPEAEAEGSGDGTTPASRPEPSPPGSPASAFG